jgi:hypothetical protein
LHTTRHYHQHVGSFSKLTVKGRTTVEISIQGGANAEVMIVARRVQLVRSVIRCFQWRFNAWADEFVDLYFKSIACPYAEVSAS